MGDLFPFRRKPSPWRSRAPARATRSGLREAFSGFGLIALAVLATGVLHFSGLFQDVIIPALSRGLAADTVAVRPDNNVAVERAGNRTIRYATGPTYNAVDGDSLRTDREDVRLLGIDAPELFQTCRDARGRQWPCGREAHAKLKMLVSRGEVRCIPTGRDRFNRALAVCSVGSVTDLGETMVREGFAVDFMNGGRYAGAEAEARRARRGIWAGEFEAPQEWRRRNPRGADRG
jgi:endonuclease YncB( thermonuclease family)